MATWQAPIFDRSENDISYAKTLLKKIKVNGISSLTADELSAWQSELKGCFSYFTLNRVLANVQVLNDILGVLGYEHHDFHLSKDSWTYFDTPGAGDLTSLCSEVRSLCKITYVDFSSVPTTFDNLSIDKMNQVEQAEFKAKEFTKRVS